MFGDLNPQKWIFEVFITGTGHTCNACVEKTNKDTNDFKCAFCWLVRGVLCGVKDPLKVSRLANVWRLESVNSNIRSVHNRYRAHL